MAREDFIEIKTTCTRDCYDSCGITVLKNDNGSVHRVVGDHDHPVSRGSLCGKCALAYNGVWRDPDVRLTAPLKRVGAKGEGRFEAVGWETALADIAARLKDIVAEEGEDHAKSLRDRKKEQQATQRDLHPGVPFWYCHPDWPAAPAPWV